MHEGRWMGISEDSKGICVYWLTTKKVTTERNIYYDKTSLSVSRLKGEEWDDFVKMKTDNPLPKDEPILPPASTKTPTPDVPDSSNDQKPIDTPSETDEDHRFTSPFGHRSYIEGVMVTFQVGAGGDVATHMWLDTSSI